MTITYPRKKHAHRCPVCERSYACYKKHCDKGPRITIEQCPWHKPINKWQSAEPNHSDLSTPAKYSQETYAPHNGFGNTTNLFD